MVQMRLWPSYDGLVSPLGVELVPGCVLVLESPPEWSADLQALPSRGRVFVFCYLALGLCDPRAFTVAMFGTVYSSGWEPVFWLWLLTVCAWQWLAEAIGCQWRDAVR